MRTLAAGLLMVVFFVGTTPTWILAADQFAGEVLKVDKAALKLTVKKADGNRFTFVIDNKTSFTGAKKSLQDFAPGDHVTVEFQTGGGKYIALKVSSP